MSNLKGWEKDPLRRSQLGFVRPDNLQTRPISKVDRKNERLVHSWVEFLGVRIIYQARIQGN